MTTAVRRVKEERAADDPFFGYMLANNSDLLEAVGLKLKVEGSESNEAASTLVYFPLDASGIVTNLVATSMVYRPIRTTTEFTLLGQVTNLEGGAAASVADLRHKIESFSKFGANWDEEGAQPIPQTAIRSALRVVEHIAIVLQRKNTLSAPAVLPFPDGSIVFKWTHGSKELNITVEANNVTAQHWQPLNAYHSLGLWPISVDDTSEQVEWVLT